VGVQHMLDGTPPPVRFLSVNACCLPTGLRNHALPTLTGSAAVGVTVLLWLLLVTLLRPLQSFFSLVLALLAGAPSVLVGHALAPQAARLVGGVLYLVTGRHDFKEERLRALAELMADYDVVGVQELFDAMPSCVDRGYSRILVELAASHGLVYSATAEPPKLPSLAMGSGLLILSRYPIVDSHNFLFTSQAAFERFAVNRSAMHARIQLPRRSAARAAWEHVDFFTVHVSPALGSGLVKGVPQCFLDRFEQARTAQFRELASFVRRERARSAAASGDAPICVVAGDFNADLDFPQGGHSPAVEGPAMAIVKETMVEGCGLHDVADGQWRPTYGYAEDPRAGPVEQVLQNDGQRLQQKTDDLAFVDSSCLGRYESSPVSLAYDGGVGFTHLSDHWGVGVEVRRQ